MPRDALSRLLDDDDGIETPAETRWESHALSGWHFRSTPKGIAILLVEGDSARGMVRFPDRTVVPLARVPVKEAFSKAEAILHDGPSGWEHLDRDVLGATPENKPTPAPVAAFEAQPLEPPTCTGSQLRPFRWNFK